MDRTANEVFAEIYSIERLIESPESKGKRTSLKAYHAKLCREYRRLTLAA